MNNGRLPLEVFATLPKSREVVSIADSVDAARRLYLMKFLLRERIAEVVLVPPPVAFHISGSIGRAILDAKYEDVRRQSGDPRPQPPMIRTFLGSQPNVGQRDWDKAFSSQLVEGCEVRAFADALFLGFKVGPIYTLLSVPAPISFCLVEMIERAKQRGVAMDLATTPSPSDKTH